MISVIIPVYNAARTLSNCLDSIFNLDYTDFEVIIVNDCSTDNSLDIAKQYNVKIINHEKNFGPGVARNNGAKIANGSILAFTDSDCEVPRDWLRKFEDFFKKNQDVAIITGPYSKSVETKFISIFQHYDISRFQERTSGFINTCTSCNLACKKDIFFEICGFSETWINEDWRLAFKLPKQYKIYWHKENGVAHNYRATFKSYFKQQISWVSTTIMVYLLYPHILIKSASFSKRDVVLDLFFSSLFFVTIPLIFFNFYFLWILIFSFIILFLLNLNFLNKIRKEISLKFTVYSIFFVLIRNFIWILGIIKGLKLYIFKRNCNY